MQRALVFAGQGSHKQGMGMEAMSQSPNAAKLWRAVEDRMRDRFGISISECIRDNPSYICGFEGCAAVKSFPPFADRVPPPPESRPRSHQFRLDGGVLGLTQVAQPSIVLAQLAMLEAIKDTYPRFMDSFRAVAGHSLGEITALAAIGVFSAEVAVELVYRRGLHMQEAVGGANALMYAVNPTRAKLKDTLPSDAASEDDVLAYLVELIALKVSKTTSWLEMVNYNVGLEQIVIAGDPVALSILGKCLDPQMRAAGIERSSAQSLKDLVNWSATEVFSDCANAINAGINEDPLPDYVPGSFHRARRWDVFARKLLTMDDGHTLPLERLSRLTLEGEGQSGLKKKSWFIPLPVTVPFHSSRLRKAADEFHSDCLDALPSGIFLEEKLLGDVSWVTNVTGTCFSNDDKFIKELSDAVNSQNVGEYTHSGQHCSAAPSILQKATVRLSTDRSTGVRELVALSCSSQVAHAVQWTDAMDTISSIGVGEVIEVSPTKTLCNMFKRGHGHLMARALPFDERLVFK